MSLPFALPLLIAAVTLSPDHRTLVTGGNQNAVRLWDLPSCTLRRTFLGHGNTVTAVAFSHDGRRIASASMDGTVRIWRESL